MKPKSLFFLISFALYFRSYAADPLTINSKIKDVTVYLNGAQITREASIKLPKGNTILAFVELPLNVDPQSIQARGDGKFIILSLVHQINYLGGYHTTTQVKHLQDSLKIYEDQIVLQTGLLSVLKNEEELLNANREIGSSEKGVVLYELKLIADFYRTRLTEIKKEEIKNNNTLELIKEKAERIKNQLDQLNAKLNQPTSEILVNVSCIEPLEGRLSITYTVFDAGWIPEYDLRAKNIQNPVELFYNAKVFQNTGEEWNNVSLKLSTANPQQRGEKPDLQPWFIDFFQPVQPLLQYNRLVVEEEYAPVKAASEPASEMKKDKAETPAYYTNISENQTNMEFSIKIPYDIPSDNKKYSINIQQNTLPATYEYYCAPKLDREAFLIARITGWEGYNLLSGEINLFFEETFVGKSYLNVRNTKDTLDLSLGRDKGIVVTRVKLKDYSEEKTIGSNKRETRTWEITIRNNKKQSVNLRLEDQFPVSMNKDIVVEPLNYDNAKYNSETGLLTWRQKIEPSQEKKIRVSYAIKYPKDKTVYID